MSAPNRTLIINAVVYSHDVPFATALLIDSDRIVWVGDAAGAEVHKELADRIIDAQGFFLAPAFVDAHVHATSTGLMLDGLDLSGVRSKDELLNLLEQYARSSKGAPILGHGWDESQWQFADLPTRSEIDRASWGSVVYLSRIDVHSALVSSALVGAKTEVASLNGFTDCAVSGNAHRILRERALSLISSSQRRRAQRSFLTHCLSQGIASVHEMAGPGISSVEDARSLIDLARTGVNTPEVFVYWGELAKDGGIDRALELGAIGAGGDLFVDGAIGSRTAALHEPYSDDTGSTGLAYLTSEEISDHLVACTESNLQGGFHVIGDRGAAIVLEGITTAAAQVGNLNFRRIRHRLEHTEMLTDSDITSLALQGVTASMQPLFDEFWGGPGGMYEQRLGERSASMNRWGTALSQGVSVCFSSDSPVTPNDPWKAIHAAIHHNNDSEQISARAAFAAHTRAGWRALGPGFDDRGVIKVGAVADLTLWKVEDFSITVPDARVAGWSTDPRSGTNPLPALGDRASFAPPCLQFTMVAGKVAWTTHSYAEYLDAR